MPDYRNADIDWSGVGTPAANALFGNLTAAQKLRVATTLGYTALAGPVVYYNPGAAAGKQFVTTFVQGTPADYANSEVDWGTAGAPAADATFASLTPDQQLRVAAHLGYTYDANVGKYFNYSALNPDDRIRTTFTQGPAADYNNDQIYWGGVGTPAAGAQLREPHRRAKAARRQLAPLYPLRWRDHLLQPERPHRQAGRHHLPPGRGAGLQQRAPQLGRRARARRRHDLRQPHRRAEAPRHRRPRLRRIHRHGLLQPHHPAVEPILRRHRRRLERAHPRSAPRCRQGSRYIEFLGTVYYSGSAPAADQFRTDFTEGTDYTNATIAWDDGVPVPTDDKAFADLTADQQRFVASQLGYTMYDGVYYNATATEPVRSSFTVGVDYSNAAVGLTGVLSNTRWIVSDGAQEYMIHAADPDGGRRLQRAPAPRRAPALRPPRFGFLLTGTLTTLEDNRDMSVTGGEDSIVRGTFDLLGASSDLTVQSDKWVYWEGTANVTGNLGIYGGV